jgi:hypothetical protein
MDTRDDPCFMKAVYLTSPRSIHEASGMRKVMTLPARLQGFIGLFVEQLLSAVIEQVEAAEQLRDVLVGQAVAQGMIEIGSNRLD